MLAFCSRFARLASGCSDTFRMLDAIWGEEIVSHAKAQRDRGPQAGSPAADGYSLSVFEFSRNGLDYDTYVYSVWPGLSRGGVGQVAKSGVFRLEASVARSLTS